MSVLIWSQGLKEIILATHGGKCSKSVRSYYYLIVVVIVHVVEGKAIKTQLKLVYRRYAILLKQRPWVTT